MVIGHSLGSVVAYELLCAPAAEWNVDTLITLGSPLGIPNLIFDRLDPAPRGGTGAFPRGIKQWVNVASPDDIVAAQKSLAPMFEGPVTDHLIDNGAESHAAERYLTAAVTGAAVAAAISGS